MMALLCCACCAVLQMEIGPCPPAQEVCPYKGCPENQGKVCDGQGWCLNGECHCAVDRAGPACAQLLCDTDADCPRDQTCSPTKECGGGSFPLQTGSSGLDFDSVCTAHSTQHAAHSTKVP